MDGVINLDKPAGLSSARAVARVKGMLPRGTKVGHAGTLDPFATGVLLILVGKATRRCEALMNEPKGYEATVRLGASSETDDRDSPAIVTAGAVAPDIVAISQALVPLTGLVLQKPPVYSALKIAGRRAYDLARSGRPVELAERTVRVDSIDLLRYEWPLLTIAVRCGRGTYIRAIARDLGAALRTGGYLDALRRTAVGRFDAMGAVKLADLSSDNIQKYLQETPPVLHGAPAAPYNPPSPV